MIKPPVRPSYALSSRDTTVYKTADSLPEGQPVCFRRRGKDGWVEERSRWAVET